MHATPSYFENKILFLESQAESIRDLHTPDPDNPEWCDECSSRVPCNTLRLLGGV